MFTTGSKLFIGGTVLSLAGTIVFAVSNGGPTGLLGTIGLVSLTLVFAFLAGVNFFNRDGNVPSMQQGIEYTAAAAQPPVGRSIWPLIGAVGVAGIVVGAVSKPVVFKVAVIVVLAAAVEWMVQGWSERASADGAYNADVRRRILHPLEFPLLAATGLVAIVYSFSRIMLSVDKVAGEVIFGVVGALVLIGGFIVAAKRNVTKGTIAGVCTIAAAALIGAGVASAVQGQRTIDKHPAPSAELCLKGGFDAEVDDNASQDVSAKSNVVANIVLQSNGIVIARVNGRPGEALSAITVPHGAVVRVRFHNDFSSPQRLTIRAGTFDGGAEAVSCTTAVNPGKEAFLEFKIPRPQASSSTPFVLLVPGMAGQEIKVVVP